MFTHGITRNHYTAATPNESIVISRYAPILKFWADINVLKLEMYWETANLP